MAISIEARAELITLVVGMFGAAPGASVLSDLVAASESGASVKQIAANIANTAEFTSIYPTFLTNEEFATKLVENLVGSTVTATDKANAATEVAAMLNGGASRSSVIVDVIAALQSVPEDNEFFGAASTQFNNRVDVATYFSVEKQQSGASLEDLQEVIASVNETDASVTQAKEVIDGTADAGQAFVLTASADTFTGGSGNDSFEANVIVNPANGVATIETLTALDVLTGGDGDDTLVYTTAGGDALPAATISGIETISVVSDGAVTANVGGTNVTGVTTLNAKAAAGAVDLDTKSNVTSIAVTGTATTVDIDDNGAVDKLTSVSVSGATGAITIDSGKLDTLTLIQSDGGATITAAAATRALTLNVNGLTAGTITDATATGLTISSTGAASSGITVAAAAAKAVTIAADETLTIAALTAAAATSLTVTGDAKVTLTAATLTALTSVDASAQTAGGFDSKAIAFGTGVAFKGGAGADSIQLGATTKAITTGAGNDRVLLSATTVALGTGGSVDAGEGTTDTLAFADGDDAGTVSATATFEASISGFEVVELAGAAGAAVTLNLANLDDISSVKLSTADLGQALTITNMASGGTFAATVTQTGATSIGVINALANAADVVNVSLAGAAAVDSGVLTIADVETVNYLTDDTATTPTGIAHISSLTAAAVKAITVTGDAGLTLTNTATTVTSFDASGVTKGAVTWTTGALAAEAAITGGAGANTIDFSAATKAVTYTGGAAVDTVTGNAKDNTINTAAGDDVVTLGAGKNTVDLGAGDDTITLGANLNIVTLGAGDDTVNAELTANGNTYSTLTDFAAGDSISFVAASVGAIADATLGAKVTLGGTAAFADFLNAASAGATGATNGLVEWFEYGGDTYVVLDNSNQVTYENGVDTIIKLTGSVDLSTATLTAEVLTLAA